MPTTGVSGPQNPSIARPGRSVTIGGREVPVILPSRKDPRLRLSIVIMTLQLLGQTVLGFKVSIAQILTCLVVCGIVDSAMMYRLQGVLAWPASGLLTGNSVAFIMRASGTRHGDWWSFHGIWFFVGACLLSLASKYLIRHQGKHIFNPSNVGIVWALIVIGPGHVFPQYLWWGNPGVPVGLALAVIFLGGAWVLKSVRMHGMALSYMTAFAACLAVFAAAGRHFYAIWHQGPIHGLPYWLNIVASPELLIFVFFMMSDPQTAPRSARGRVIYGAATALVAASLIFFQQTEFGIKLAILSSLTVTCALVPLIEKIAPRPGDAAKRSEPLTRWLAAAIRRPAIVAAIIIAIAAPADTAALAGNLAVLNIERGLTGVHNPQ